MSGAVSQDLLPKMAEFYDPHLVKTIVDYIGDSGNVINKEFDPAKLLSMQEEIVKSIGEKTEEAGKEILDLKNSILDLLAIIEMPALLSELHKCQTIQAMSEAVFHIPEIDPQQVQQQAQEQQQQAPTSFRQVNGVSKEQFQNLYKYAHKIYGQGNYSDCADLLVVYNQQLRILEKDPEAEVTLERQLNVKWGLLACYILEGKWEQAAFAALILDAVIDEKITKKQEVLKQRTCLAHWLLFIVFKIPSDKTDIIERGQVAKVIEMLISEKYLTLMSFYAPHLFRYAAACFMFYKHDKTFKDDLVHILGHEYRKVNEENTNSDIMEKNDLIEFLLALFIDMDFEKAKTLLSQIQTTYPYANDYFLHDKAELLSLNCRILVFENYCKIHQSVEVSTVAERMAMSVQDAEAWIVDKMRLGKLPFASIFFDESDKAFVSFERKTNKDVAYKTIVDKTNTMAYRLYMLQVNSGTIVNKKDTLNLTDISPEINQHLVGAGLN